MEKHRNISAVTRTNGFGIMGSLFINRANSSPVRRQSQSLISRWNGKLEVGKSEVIIKTFLPRIHANERELTEAQESEVRSQEPEVSCRFSQMNAARQSRNQTTSTTESRSHGVTRRNLIERKSKSKFNT